MSTKMKWVLVILIVVLMSLAVFSVAVDQTEVATPLWHNAVEVLSEKGGSILSGCTSVGSSCGTG